MRLRCGNLSVKIIEVASEMDFAKFGIRPTQVDGLYGVMLAPLIRGSWSHLASNSVALLVLGTAPLFGYPGSAKIVLLILYLGTGLCVWFFCTTGYALRCERPNIWHDVFRLYDWRYSIG